MAKITRMPHEAQIAGFKGVIDYYVHEGVPCVRRWPRSPGHRRAPQVEKGWVAFTYAVYEWQNIPQEIRDTYEQLASASGLSSRDMFMRSYLSGLYRYPTAEFE